MTKKKSKIRILIAGERRLIMNLLCNALKREDAVESVTESESLPIVAELALKHQPNIIILDVALSIADGIETISKIRTADQQFCVLAFAPKLMANEILQLVNAGAKGCISETDACTQDLVKAVKTICKGEYWINRKIAARLLNHKFHKNSKSALGSPDATQGLTKREQEVFKLAIKGHSNKEIADALFVSEKTIKSHLNHIFKKLDVKRRMDLILYAAENKLL